MERLRGSAETTVDEKGRFKVPAVFREPIEETFGKEYPDFDPFPFGLLTMIVSLEAIFLATFVLLSQNRQTFWINDMAGKPTGAAFRIRLANA